MKNIFYLAVISLVILTSGCSKEEEKNDNTLDSLAYTSWSGTWYDASNDKTLDISFNFFTKTSVSYTILDAEQNQSYAGDYKIVKGGNLACKFNFNDWLPLMDDKPWIIIEMTQRHLVMQRLDDGESGRDILDLNRLQ